MSDLRNSDVSASKDQEPDPRATKLEQLLEKAHTSKTLAAFADKLLALTSSVDRLGLAFDFMRSCISGGFGSRRAEFWQVKQICLSLFKEPLEPSFRYPLWQQFTEILDSADLATEVLAESSAFYFEQFKLALDDLNKQVDANDEANLASFSLIDKLGFDGTAQAAEEFIRGLQEELFSLQRRLKRLCQFATRFRALREEIVNCELRPRDKRTLFEGIALLRGKIFPAKEALTEQIDKLFNEEVGQFVVNASNCGEPTKPIYVLKQQLKALQQLAKELGLSSEGFKQARLKLSELWDLLSALEEAQREKIREQRAQSLLSASEVSEKIERLKSEVPKLDYEMLTSRIKQIIRFMHGQHLLREDKKRLRADLESIGEPFLNREALKEEKKTEALSKKERANGEAFKKLTEQIDQLGKVQENYDERRAEIEAAAGRLDLNMGQLREVQMRLADAELLYQKSMAQSLELAGDEEGLARHKEKERAALQKRLDALKKEKAGVSLSFERGFAIEEEIARLKGELERF